MSGENRVTARRALVDAATRWWWENNERTELAELTPEKLAYYSAMGESLLGALAAAGLGHIPDTDKEAGRMSGDEWTRELAVRTTAYALLSAAERAPRGLRRHRAVVDRAWLRSLGERLDPNEELRDGYRTGHITVANDAPPRSDGAKEH